MYKIFGSIYAQNSIKIQFVYLEAICDKWLKGMK